jgi:hypothetical protein
VEGELLEKEPTSNERECCIFGSRYIYDTREVLGSVEREHAINSKV